jgi:hypothetical protein
MDDISEAGNAIESANHLSDSDPSGVTSSSSTPGFPRPTTSPIWKYCRVEEGKVLPAAWVGSVGRKWWHCQPCFAKKKEKKYNYSGG